MERVKEMTAKGTGAIEIKSGYGLTLEDELKMLRVIRRIKETTSVMIKATFLGAHAIGRGYSHEAYVDLVCNEMIPAVASEKLAEYVDVFCEEGFFSVSDADRIMSAGEARGLVPKIHANQLACSGGVQIAAAHDALSVDHLEDTGEAEIEALRGKRTMPTMLPGASFFLNMQYGRAKEYINAGLGVALASGLQSWFLPFRRHALRYGTRMHQDEAHPSSSVQRMHLEFGLRHGSLGHLGIHRRWKSRQPHNHQASPFPRIHPILPPESIHPQSNPSR
jgi:imidazolonepropionase